MKIAILAWGSLIWEIENERGKHLDLATDWVYGGPKLPIEFSRVSSTHNGALTLVIDPANGEENQSFFAESKYLSRENAIANLARREGTSEQNIGFVDRRTSQSYSAQLSLKFKVYSEESRNNICAWAEKNNFDAVIWTALLSNFDSENKSHKARYINGDKAERLNVDVRNMKFTVDNALKYLHCLKEPAATKASVYVTNTSQEVDTPLRKAIRHNPLLFKCSQ